MNGSWFSVEKEEEKDIETEYDIKELYKKIKDLSSTITGMSSTIDKLSSTIVDMSEENKNTKEKVSTIEVANLKLINRILEAEISLERTKNILLRKNISFPFVATPLSNRFL